METLHTKSCIPEQLELPIMGAGKASWRHWSPKGADACVGVSSVRGHCRWEEAGVPGSEERLGGLSVTDMAEAYTWRVHGGWHEASLLDRLSKGSGLVLGAAGSQEHGAGRCAFQKLIWLHTHLGEGEDCESGAFLPLVTLPTPTFPDTSMEPCFPLRHSSRQEGKRAFGLPALPTLVWPPAWNAALDPFTPKAMESE